MNITMPEMIFNESVVGTVDYACRAFQERMDFAIIYMQIMTFAVVVYLVVVYILHIKNRLNRDKFRRRVQDGIFILIITSGWLFENAIIRIIFG